MERAPAVAGLFYPADSGSLRRTVLECLGEPSTATVKPVAVLVPHAGYRYSGRTAGRVYGAMTVPPSVILLGPNHTGMGRPASVWVEGDWLTPLGRVPVETDMAAALVAAHDHLEADTLAHAREHSLEVQVPFLQVLRPDVRIVPIVLADCGCPQLLEMGRVLAEQIRRSDRDWLILISSDMTHFESREVARRQDRYALDRLEDLDAAGLYDTVRRRGISMCGVVPAVVGLAAATALGAGRGRLLDYSCSGDVTGDDSDVVAYAGLTIT